MGRGQAMPFTSINAADETGKDGWVLGLPPPFQHLSPMNLVLMEIREVRDRWQGGLVTMVGPSR